MTLIYSLAVVHVCIKSKNNSITVGSLAIPCYNFILRSFPSPDGGEICLLTSSKFIGNQSDGEKVVLIIIFANIN